MTSGAVAAPFALTLQVWDETAATYRTAYTLQDGLGRVLQTQGPDETGAGLILADTAYDARGAVKYTGRPRAQLGTGGTLIAPN